MRMIKQMAAIIIFAVMVTGNTIPTYAKANLAALQNGTFSTLSDQDKQDTATALVNKVKTDLGVKGNIRVHFFNWSNSKVAAYSYMNPNDIYINSDIFRNSAFGASEGLTIEQYVVRTLAHEVRHIYQEEHINDDTDYGRKCKNARNGYVSYNQDVAQYEANFLEKDSDAFGADYVNKFIKVKSYTKQYRAADGKIFDPVFYANTYPDVKNALGTDPQVLLNHYNTYGIKEGRLPSFK